MNFYKKYFGFLAKGAVVGSVFALGTLVAIGATWAGPTGSAPSNNASAPITTTGDQSKTGGLILNAVKADNSYAATGLDVLNGKIGFGTAAPTGKFDVTGGTMRALDSGLNDAGLYPTSGKGLELIYTANAGGAQEGGYVQAYDRTSNAFKALYLNGSSINTNATLNVGTVLNIGASIGCIAGLCPTNGAVRLTPNLHLNAMAHSAVIVNWDNGNNPADMAFRVGTGAGADAVVMYSNGTIRAQTGSFGGDVCIDSGACLSTAVGGGGGGGLSAVTTTGPGLSGNGTAGNPLYSRLSWGADGRISIDGAANNAGVLFTDRVMASSITQVTASDTDGTALAICPTGYRVMSGGINNPTGAAITTSVPNIDNKGWDCRVSGNVSITCYAMCIATHPYN